MNATANTRKVTMSAKVIRADGRVEDHGVIYRGVAQKQSIISSLKNKVKNLWNKQ